MMELSVRHIIRVWAVVIGAALLSLGCINDADETAEETTLVKIGQLAPDFTVEMTDGSCIRLSELRGKVVLLTFWDPECPTCRREMAEAQNRIVERMESAGVKYLPISRGYDKKTITDFCKNNGYTFPVGIDPNKEIYGLYATKFVPRSFIIDKGGIICYIYVEYELNKLEEILTAAETLTKE